MPPIAVRNSSRATLGYASIAHGSTAQITRLEALHLLALHRVPSDTSTKRIPAPHGVTRVLRALAVKAGRATRQLLRGSVRHIAKARRLSPSVEDASDQAPTLAFRRVTLNGRGTVSSVPTRSPRVPGVGPEVPLVTWVQRVGSSRGNPSALGPTSLYRPGFAFRPGLAATWPDLA